MTKKTSKLVVLFLAFALVLSACGQGGDSGNGDSKQDDLFITVATGGTSGVYYPIGGAISSIIERELGFDTSVQATQASVENINLINTNRAELAITMADAVLQAYESFGAFEGEAPMENLRGFTSLYPNFVQIVTTADTGITSFEDLRGKRVGVGAPNSGVELNARMMFEAHGMTYDDISADYLSYSEAIDQIKNGLIDAAFVTSGLGNSTIIDLGTTHNVVIVPVEGAGMDNLRELYPFFSANVIPAGTYGNAADINTASIMNVLLINHTIPEDVAYDMAKAFFENLNQIHNSHNAAKEVSLDTVAEGMVVPFHPGVEKYLKEVGAIQ